MLVRSQNNKKVTSKERINKPELILPFCRPGETSAAAARRAAGAKGAGEVGEVGEVGDAGGHGVAKAPCQEGGDRELKKRPQRQVLPGVEGQRQPKYKATKNE